MLSVSLNTMTAVNEFIPVNYNKINNLELLDVTRAGSAGSYSKSLSRIILKNTPEMSNKNAVLAINLAHEYGHHVYNNILTSGDIDLIKKMEYLIEKMGEVFINKDQNKIKEIIGPTGGFKKSYDKTMEYLSNPTEMFARAFSGLVLKDMESTFEKGTCFGYNYTSKELENFEKELKDICSAYSQKVLSSSKETAINKNLFKNLNATQKAIICKNENLLYNKNIYKNNEEHSKNKNIKAESILRKKTYTSIYNNSSEKVRDNLEFKYPDDVYIGDTYSDIVNNFKTMMPDEFYSKEQTLLKNKENIEKRMLNLEGNENVKQLNKELESININLMALSSTGIKDTEQYKYYATLKNKENSIDNFLNRFDVASEGKIASKFENLKLVQYVKESIVKKFDYKLSNIKNEIGELESKYNKTKILENNPTEYYACKDSSKANTIYKHNGNMLIGRYENGYDFGLDKHLRQHQLARKHLENYVVEKNSIHPEIIYCQEMIDDTYNKVNKGLLTYDKLNSAMHEKVTTKMKEKIPFYNTKEKSIEEEVLKEDKTKQKSTVVDNLLKKVEEKSKNKEKTSLLSDGARKQFDDFLAKCYDKENINPDINKTKQIENYNEVEF